MRPIKRHIKFPVWDKLSYQQMALLPGLKTGNNSIEKASAQSLFFAQKRDCPWASAFQIVHFNFDINIKQFAYETIP